MELVRSKFTDRYVRVVCAFGFVLAHAVVELPGAMPQAQGLRLMLARSKLHGVLLFSADIMLCS